MSNPNNAGFTHSLSTLNESATKGFRTNSFLLTTEKMTHILGEFEKGTYLESSTLNARELTVCVSDFRTTTILPGKVEHSNPSNSKNFTDQFFPFLIHSTKGLYILIVSKFNIFNEINLEPSAKEEAIESFHNQLKKSFHLKYATAYFGTETEEMSDAERKSSGIVAVLTTHFDYLTEDGLSYVLFTI